MVDEGSKPNTDQDVILDGEDEETQEGFDFSNEYENLTSGSQWFNPEPGTHEVKFLDNGKSDTREYEGETRPVGIFTVEVSGEEKKWSVTKGQSESSLWGQLMKYGKSQGSLKGEEITLIRSGEGTDTTYTVQEAADL